MTLSQNSQSKPPERDCSHCIEGRVTQNAAIIWQYFFRLCYYVISHENAQSVGKFYKCCEIKPDPQNTKPLHNPHLPSFLSRMTGDFHSRVRGQGWDLWDKADLTEWKGLTWGTWENRGKDCLLWHISNNPGCLGKESWENSELSILPIQVFQTCQGNTFQNWMLERTVPKEKWKCPNSQFNIAKRYGGNKLLGQQQATLSWCKTVSVSVPLWKGGLGGFYHTLLGFQAFVEFIFPNPQKHQSHMEVFPSWGRKY